MYRGYEIREAGTQVAVYWMGEFICYSPNRAAAEADIDGWLNTP